MINLDETRIISKRFTLFMHDIFNLSFLIIIIASCVRILITIFEQESIELFSIIMNSTIFNFLATISSGFFFTIFKIFVPFAFDKDATPHESDMIVLVILLRCVFVSLYQYRHYGFSEGGKRVGLRVVKQDGTACSYCTLFIRNFMRFSGGFSLYFIPSILPAFDGSGRSMIDRLLKVKIIEEDYFDIQEHGKGEII